MNEELGREPHQTELRLEDIPLDGTPLNEVCEAEVNEMIQWFGHFNQPLKLDGFSSHQIEIFQLKISLMKGRTKLMIGVCIMAYLERNVIECYEVFLLV